MILLVTSLVWGWHLAEVARDCLCLSRVTSAVPPSNNGCDDFIIRLDQLTSHSAFGLMGCELTSTYICHIPLPTHGITNKIHSCMLNNGNLHVCVFSENKPGHPLFKHFLYNYLKDQPIWKSLQFWNAAFFDAVQCERERKPIPTR